MSLCDFLTMNREKSVVIHLRIPIGNKNANHVKRKRVEFCRGRACPSRRQWLFKVFGSGKPVPYIVQGFVCHVPFIIHTRLHSNDGFAVQKDGLNRTQSVLIDDMPKRTLASFAFIFAQCPLPLTLFKQIVLRSKTTIIPN
jgi:hypothetical protein